MKVCERCGYTLDPSSYDLLDFCESCGKDLCDECLAEGCCPPSSSSGVAQDTIAE